MTSCIIEIKKGNTQVARVFFTADGYPSGVPYDIAKEFKNHKIVNGLTFRKLECNGIEDFAVQMIASQKSPDAAFVKTLKTVVESIGGEWDNSSVKAGGVYLVPLDEHWNCNYKYTIEEKDGELRLSTEGFSGTLKQYAKAIRKKRFGKEVSN